MRRSIRSAAAVAGVLLLPLPAGVVQATPVEPSYFGSIADHVTGDNEFPFQGQRFWDVDAGADVWALETYERPTIQAYQMVNGRYATPQYFEYLDITGARAGFDSQYLYVAIDVFGRRELRSDGTEQVEGLKNAFYGFQLSTQAAGRGGMYFYVDQPETSGNGTTYGLLKGFGFRDGDGDVGGTGIGTTGEFGNGYEQALVADGLLSGTSSAVFFSRISPMDDTMVEFALDYAAVGLSQQDLLGLMYFNVDVIKGGPVGPAMYLFNDQYTRNQSGSPNPGSGGMSEFGTQGLGNIYEMDSLSGVQSVIPEPTCGLGLIAMALFRPRRLRN